MRKDLSVYRIFLTITTLEGLVALALLFWTPSEPGSAVLFGYSRSRIALGAGAAIGVIGFAGIAFKALADRGWLARVHWRLGEWLARADRLLYLTTSLVFLSAAGIGLILFLESPLSKDMDTLRAVYARSASLLLWGVAIMLQGLAALGWGFGGLFRRPGWFKRGRAGGTLLVWLIVTAAGFHAWVLIFREAIFTGIEGWFWQFHPKAFGARDLIFVGLALLTFAAAVIVVRQPKHRVRNLTLLIALGYALQIGFGFIEGQGFESIRLKYAESPYHVYAAHASDRPALADVLLDYEENYGDYLFVETKPPGLLATFIALQKLSNSINPAESFEARFNRLTTVMAYVFPLFSFLVLAPIYRVSKLLWEDGALHPTLLYVLCPNVILIPLLYDQVLFPLLFVFGVLLALLTVQRRSFWLAVGTGAFTYLAAFFSFSMLPLAPLAFALIGFDHWANRSEQSLRDAARLAAGVALGIAGVFLLFYLALDYDFITRYTNGLREHREFKRLETGTGSVLRGLLINNLEFAVWTGFPIVILFVAQAVRSARAFVRDRVTQPDALMAALGVTFVLLNLGGQTVSEVGRLWLFLVPVIALYAAREARRLFEKKATGLYLVVALQLVVVFLTYKFQDFY